MKSTVGMLGKKGRSFHAGERGRDLQDPGATSCWLIFKTLAETLETL
jgi:dihydroxyacetone kinase-like protein